MQRFNLRLGSLGVITLVVVALALWMATGHYKHRATDLQPPKIAADHEAQPAGAAKAAAAPFEVEVSTQQAETTARTISLSGDTAPSRTIELAGQVEGQVVAVLARKGARLRAGDVIARLDPRDWLVHRNRAEAALKQAQLEYGAATRLRERGYVTEGEIAGKFAQLQTAKAAQADADFQIKHLTLTAPVNGVIEEQHIEVGNYVRVGDKVARILVTDPLLVSANVSENDVASMHVGSPASAVVANETLRGHVSFVSAMADAKTRTFTVEISVENPGSRLPAGLSAQVSLPVGTAKAHRLPSSLLSLGDDGVLGVKHVGSDGKAIFTPVSILKADGDAVWVAGLPEQVRLITQGQGFIKAGEVVHAAAAAATTLSNAAAGAAAAGGPAAGN